MTDPKTDAASPSEKTAEQTSGQTSEESAGQTGNRTAGAEVRPEPLRAVTAPSASAPDKPAPAPRARGGGVAVFGALVALAAAGASIAGPSLRPYLAEQLTARFGEHELIGVLTGTAAPKPAAPEPAAPKPNDAVQIDLAAFDRRVEALAQALAQAQPAGSSADPATLSALVTALGQPLPAPTPAPAPTPSPEAGRLDGLEGRLTALNERLDALDRRLGEAAAEAAAGAAKAQADLAARLEPRLETAVQTGTAQSQRSDALEQALETAKRQGSANLDALAGRLDERIAAADRRLAELEARDARAAAANDVAALLTLVSRIRLSIELAEPFAAEVKALATVAGSDADARAALEALGTVAAQGVPNLPRLQRALTPLLAAIVETERAAGASSWYTHAATLLTWSEPAPSRADILAEKTEGIARDLRSGQLSGAVWKLRALDVPLGEGVQGWIAEANRRAVADQALRTLTELAFRRIQG